MRQKLSITAHDCPTEIELSEHVLQVPTFHFLQVDYLATAICRSHPAYSTTLWTQILKFFFCKSSGVILEVSNSLFLCRQCPLVALSSVHPSWAVHLRRPVVFSLTLSAVVVVAFRRLSFPRSFFKSVALACHCFDKCSTAVAAHSSATVTHRRNATQLNSSLPRECRPNSADPLRVKVTEWQMRMVVGAILVLIKGSQYKCTESDLTDKLQMGRSIKGQFTESY